MIPSLYCGLVTKLLSFYIVFRQHPGSVTDLMLDILLLGQTPTQRLLSKSMMLACTVLPLPTLFSIHIMASSLLIFMTFGLFLLGLVLNLTYLRTPASRVVRGLFLPLRHNLPGSYQYQQLTLTRLQAIKLDNQQQVVNATQLLAHRKFTTLWCDRDGIKALLEFANSLIQAINDPTTKRKLVESIIDWRFSQGRLFQFVTNLEQPHFAELVCGWCSTLDLNQTGELTNKLNEAIRFSLFFTRSEQRPEQIAEINRTAVSRYKLLEFYQQHFLVVDRNNSADRLHSSLLSGGEFSKFVNSNNADLAEITFAVI